MDNRDIVAATLAAAIFNKFWPNLPKPPSAAAQAEAVIEAVHFAIQIQQLVLREMPEDQHPEGPESPV